MPPKSADRSESEVAPSAERKKNSGRNAKTKPIAPKSAFPLRKRSALKDGSELDQGFPVVAIGASAGGLEAYKEFFHALAVDTGMAFVLIQHLDPSHHSMLAEILSKATKIPVDEVKDGVKVKPNRVYVIPPGTFMAITADVFTLTPRSQESGQHLAVNFFMRSLAEERKSGAIGVVLSGTGTDGTLGLESIKAEGGIAFAQDPATARYDGMPRSAIDSGCVDFVLPPKEIAQELHRIRRHPYIRQDERGAEEQGKELADSVAPPNREDDFIAILDQLRKSSGVDFRQYKPNTIHRRALRRAVILKLDSLGEYAKYLKEHPEEGPKLYDDVLIPVTSFFRDFEAFEALKAQVYPTIVKDKGNKGTIRMWAPGCSTGEETYSLAMTLLEFLGDKAASFQVQIFGTDLNEKGIQKACTGMYRESIAEEISPERLQRFFVKVEGGYRVNKAVRDLCVFARQNLASDPPFSQMNLVACRNLLIYIQPALQKKIIPILHYALKSSVFLILGGSESVAAFPDLFATVDKKHKIYGKKAVTSRLHYDFVQNYYPTPAAQDSLGKPLKSQAPATEESDLNAEADRLVLQNHGPAGVVINDAMEVLHFRGRTAPYLEQSPGKPSQNVLKLARNGLGIELRTLISAARKKGTPVRKDGVLFEGNGSKRILDLSVSPLGQKGNPSSFLVLFDDVTPQWPPPEDASRGKAKQGSREKPESKRMKQDLADAQEALRSAIESEDSFKEEFQSANEEILSANEELQSTNEELETSKEELQSANEELNTLNAELRNKNSELQELSNDISNLLNSTRIPVVMLDLGLRIRRLTSTADKLLKVRPSDIGRSLADIKSNLEAPDLERAIATVLESLVPMEQEVRDLDGRWVSLSILPYRTQENKIDGVVLALQDIDAIKRANEQLRQSAEFFRGVINTVVEPLLVLDGELRVIMANDPFLSTFNVSTEKTVNKLLYDLGNGQWNIPRLRTLLEEILPKHQIVRGFTMEHDFEDIGPRTMLLNAHTLSLRPDAKPMILLAIEDITERAHAETALRESEERFRTLFDLGPVAVYYCDASGVIQNFNHRATELWGRTPAHGDTDERFCGSLKMLRLDGSLMPHEQCPMAEVVSGKIREIRNQEVIVERPDGSQITVVVNIRPLKNERGDVTGGVNCFYDISERKLAEQASARLAAIVESSHDAVIGKDLNGIIETWNAGAERLFGYTQEEAIGQSITLLFPPDRIDEEPAILERIRRGEHVDHYESVRQRKDGRLVNVSLTISPIIDVHGQIVGASKIARDISERKLAETALIKSEKLAASGRLAAILAHEINNPLQAVTNLMSLLGKSPRLDTQEQAYAAMAEEELSRVVHLTQQSLSFYRESTHPVAVNLNQVLDGVLELYAQRLQEKQIVVVKRDRSDGMVINSYPGEIRQVLTTLLLNAMDAVPVGGTISMGVRKSLHRNNATNGIRLAIADSGVGIPTNHIARIFEPFFTTKGEQGIGLGLWVANGIVSRLGGSIQVRSSVRPGKSGTCFSIFLPARLPVRS
jgi:two-component system, chemotaxis family, CheB/CheR fusion protein